MPNHPSWWHCNSRLPGKSQCHRRDPPRNIATKSINCLRNKHSKWKEGPAQSRNERNFCKTLGSSMAFSKSPARASAVLVFSSWRFQYAICLRENTRTQSRRHKKTTYKLCHFAPAPPLGGRGKMAELCFNNLLGRLGLAQKTDRVFFGSNFSANAFTFLTIKSNDTSS